MSNDVQLSDKEVLDNVLELIASYDYFDMDEKSRNNILDRAKERLHKLIAQAEHRAYQRGWEAHQEAMEKALNPIIYELRTETETMRIDRYEALKGTTHEK